MPNHIEGEPVEPIEPVEPEEIPEQEGVRREVFVGRRGEQQDLIHTYCLYM